MTAHTRPDPAVLAFTVMPLATATVAALRAGGPDAYGMPAERVVSEGPGNPCRHCLNFIPEGAGMLICAHRPFPVPQPYAETGPIFLCADCAAWAGQGLPPVLQAAPDYLIRGYSPAHRIVYGTGRVVPTPTLAAALAETLSRPGVAFVDVRSARNNCFQARVFPVDAPSA